jgi:hypothetical protein
MARVRVRSLWPHLALPATLVAMLTLALLAGGRAGGCPGHDGERAMTTLGTQCAVLVPGR